MQINIDLFLRTIPSPEFHVYFLFFFNSKQSLTRIPKTVFWKRKEWRELSQADVDVQEKIGEGAFGMVYKGLVRIDGESRSCAVKMLKGK